MRSLLYVPYFLLPYAVDSAHERRLPREELQDLEMAGGETIQFGNLHIVIELT